MNKSLDELSKIYTAALQNYLTVEGEEALHLGYELGRKAIGQGLGILDVARIHQQASVAAMLPTLAESRGRDAASMCRTARGDPLPSSSSDGSA